MWFCEAWQRGSSGYTRPQQAALVASAGWSRARHARVSPPAREGAASIEQKREPEKLGRGPDVGRQCLFCPQVLAEGTARRGGRGRLRRPGMPACCRFSTRCAILRWTTLSNAGPRDGPSSTTCSSGPGTCSGTTSKCGTIFATGFRTFSSTRRRTPIPSRPRSLCSWRNQSRLERLTYPAPPAGIRSCRRQANCSWWETRSSRSTASAGPTWFRWCNCSNCWNGRGDPWSPWCRTSAPRKTW